MKKLLLILLFALPIHAQNYVRRYYSTNAPSGGCAVSTEWVNTTIHVFSYCDNGTWRSLPASAVSPTIGSSVIGGTAKSVLFVDGGGLLAQDNAYFQYDVVTHKLTLTSGLVKNLNNIRFADQFAGADAGAKIAAAIADLTGATNGVIDATNLIGDQSAASSILACNAVIRNVTIKLGVVNLSSSADPIFNNNGCGGSPGLEIFGSGVGETYIIQTATTNVAISHNSQAPLITKDFSIKSSSAQTAGAGIRLTHSAGNVNQYSIIENVEFRSQWINFDSIIASNWNLLNSIFSNVQYIGVQINQTANADSGDNKIVNNEFSSDAAITNTEAIHHIAGSGLQVSNNKFYNHKYAYHQAWNAIAGTTSDSQLTINGNLFEGSNNSGSIIRFECPVLGTFSGVTINGNYFSNSGGPTTFVDFATCASTAIINGAITGNTMLPGSDSTCINFAGRDGDGMHVSGNDCYGNVGTSVGINVGANYPSLTVGDNNFRNLGTTATFTNTPATADAGGMRFWGNVGIGVAPTHPFHLVSADDAVVGLFTGGTKAIRFGFSGITSSIEGVDNTGVGSYQNLTLGGLALLLQISGSEKMRLNSTGFGIGTTNPLRIFQVKGATDKNLAISTTDTTPIGIAAINDAGNAYVALGFKALTYDFGTGTISSVNLKTTGSATGKNVVCVDTTTGILYASSTGTDCSN